jgi:DNA-binding CsgD family transcriptional regulator
MIEKLGLDERTEEIYRYMLQHPEASLADLCEYFSEREQPMRKSLNTLADLSLVQRSEETPGQWQTVNPRLGLTAILAHQEADLARHQHEVSLGRDAVNVLLARYSALLPELELPFEFLSTLADVRLRLEQLALDARREVLAFAPGGPQPPEVLEQSRALDEASLRRGLVMCTVYLDSVRNDTRSAEYAHWLTALGGQVRTVPSLPSRMLIIDKAVAVVPVDHDALDAGALVLGGPGAVQILLALFASTWQAAKPFGAPPQRDHHGLTHQEREILSLLGTGRTDEGVARQLGVSLRTVRRIMSQLMVRMNARSRFQAGLMARDLGWIPESASSASPGPQDASKDPAE